MQTIPVTPTLAPTLALSLTAVVLLPTNMPTSTEAPSITPLPLTATPTTSATFTATETPQPPTNTSSATNTPEPSTATPLPSATVSDTPSPVPPTEIPSATGTAVPSSTNMPPPPTLTPVPTNNPTATFIPTVPLPLPLPTLLPSLTATVLLPTLVPTLVALPSGTPIPQVVIVPTTQPTAVPNVGTALPGTGVAVAPFTATVAVVTATPAPFSGQSILTANGVLQLPPVENAALVADFDVSAAGNRAVIDQNLNMTIDGVPYTGNGKHAGKLFRQARWSARGRWLAYIVETPGAQTGKLGKQATSEDGLWVLDVAAPNAAPQFVMRNYYGAPLDEELRIAVNLNWAFDEDAIMVTVRKLDGLHSVLVGVKVRADDHNPGLFDVLPYTDGTWTLDSLRYVTTGMPPGSHNRMLGTLDRKIQFTPIVDGMALNLWMQNAAQVADGRYAFLGKPSAAGQLENGTTQLALYVVSPGGVPAAVSPVLSGEVLTAQWNPTRTALLVTLRGLSGLQTMVISLDGTTTDYTAQTHGTAAVHWVR
ncbi:MAG: hypothetical protein ABI947_16695 [Chloroflexota bacterium]